MATTTTTTATMPPTAAAIATSAAAAAARTTALAGRLLDEDDEHRTGGGCGSASSGRNPPDSVPPAAAARRLEFAPAATATATTRSHQVAAVSDNGSASSLGPNSSKPQPAAADPALLRVLNFNVFAGSPLPFYQNYTSTQSLEDSRRLHLQIEKIRELQPDVVTLQEVCSDGVHRHYKEALGQLGYDSFSESQPPEALGLALLYLLYALMAGVLSFALHLSIDVLGLWSPASRSAAALWLMWWGQQETGADTTSSGSSTGVVEPKGALVFLALFLKSLVLAVLVMRKTCLAGFLGGTVKASMVVFWRRGRVRPWRAADGGGGSAGQAGAAAKAGATTLFSEQRGDWLNLFRPRGYLTARLSFRGLAVWVVNTHLNLGARQYRRRQIEELTAHCRRLGESGSVILCGDFNASPESEEIRVLREGAGLTDALAEQGCSEPTWTAKNPLTLGILIEEDHRCDYVFYRALREKHRLLNRCCRLELPFMSNTWLSDHFGILSELALHPLTAEA